MRSVAPTRFEWAQAVLAGTCSWLSDCSCLAFAFIAVGAGVPWAGLLLAYCGGQLAVNLPITPGGLRRGRGQPDGGIGGLRGGEAPTVAAVLLYRLISFWVPLPIGGACYLGLFRAPAPSGPPLGARRRGRRTRPVARSGPGQAGP